MNGWKNGYLMKRALTAEIHKVVAKTHNLDTTDILVNWLSQWREVTYPTGLVAKAGKIKLHCIGFNPQTFIVSQIKNQKWNMR